MKSLNKDRLTKGMKAGIIIVLCTIFSSVNLTFAQDDNSKLDLAYTYLNSGLISQAQSIFEDHIRNNPLDTKIYLQLAYINQQSQKYEKAFEYFRFVEKNSKDETERETAKTELGNIKNSIRNDEIQRGYDYVTLGDNARALEIFESVYRKDNKDMKICLQIAYIYMNMADYKKANDYFQNVVKNSTDKDEILSAKDQINVIYKMKPELNPKNDLSEAYSFIKTGQTSEAIKLFENYSKSNPEDTKIKLQLAYLYDKQKNTAKALENFEYVANNSKIQTDVDKAKTSINVLKSMKSVKSKGIFDMYFYNIYDSYQENYISNFLSHLGFKASSSFDLGAYVDLYLDSKSTPELIYNDRYAEGGAYVRWGIASWMSFELRGGYVRELDKKINSFNFKPILAIGKRFGQFDNYTSSTTKNKNTFYLELYTVGLYDHKFQNFFGQLSLKEAWRYGITGYSYIEFYTGQNLQGDSEQIDYNNWGEFRVGMGYKPDIMNFPTLFMEASNKFYFIGDIKNSFQIRAGFLINFNLPL